MSKGLRPPKSITIQVDNQEKDEIPLPTQLEWSDDRGNALILEVKHERLHLPTADFRIKEYPSITGIERKGSLQELRNNIFSRDSARFGRCIKRLATTFKIPILMVELPGTREGCAPTSLFGTQTPAKVWDAVYRKVYRLGLYLVVVHAPRTVTGREIVGYHIARLLWNMTWEYLNGGLDRTPLDMRKEVCHVDRSS